MACKTPACWRATTVKRCTLADETDNRSAWLNLTGKHQLNDRVQLSSNAYLRAD